MTTNRPPELSVLGFAGSLRAASYNRALLDSARSLAPDGMTVEIFDLDVIPLFNADVEAVGDPAPVTRFKAAIAGADALLIACPEYNAGVSGVLKNALDWASRGGSESVLMAKPAAILGATPGRLATARAQAQLRQVLTASGVRAMDTPGLMVGGARSLFDDAGRLTDDATMERVRKLLEALARWTRLLSPPAPPEARE